MPHAAELGTRPIELEQMASFDVDSRFVPDRLNPEEPHRLDTSVSLYDPADVEAFVGFRANVPAVIEAGDKRLMLVDLRAYQARDGGMRHIPMGDKTNGFKADFLLISPDDYDLQKGRGYKGIRAGESFTFGRNTVVNSRGDKLSDRFDFSAKEVSGKHFSIEYDRYGQLKITDHNSTNGTYITEPDYTMSSSRTIDIQSRLRDDPKFRLPDEAGPNGYFDGDPIIGRNSPAVTGGVYLGGKAREAITVKPEQDPRLESVYKRMIKQRVLSRLVGKAANQETQSVEAQLKKVYDTVHKLMKYDGDAVERFSEAYKGDKQVSLGEYVEKGIGVCRHQALLCAYLTERLIADGKMAGHVKVERNTIPEYGGTHAWATFVDSNGTEHVMDAAQDFVGTKQAARQRASSWDYYLPVS